MPKGRTPHADPPVSWKINLPESVARKVELCLLDPITRKVGFAERSRLVTALLLMWLRKKGSAEKQAFVQGAQQ